VGVVFKAAGYTLRHVEQDDAPQIFERFTSNAKTMRYLPIKVHTELSETQALVETWRRLHDTGAGLMCALVDDERPGWVVGIIGLGRFEGSVAVSLRIHRDGAGAGREFCPQLVHWLLAFPECYRVWAYTDIDNHGVANLLTKMGAKREGTARRYTVHPNISPEPRDCHIWSIVK
jgi:RimJ/RimL family protein N-acetyltransferase